MTTQADLEALVLAFDEPRLLGVMTSTPGCVFGLSVGAPREAWSPHFPNLERLDLADGWYSLGSESYPDETGVTFELAFEVADAESEREPGLVTQISFKIQFRVDGSAEAVATEARERLRTRLAGHFDTRVKRGRTLSLRGGPLVIGAVRHWEHVYASFDFAWALPDGIETTLVMQ